MFAAAVAAKYEANPYIPVTWRPWHDALARTLDSSEASDLIPRQLHVGLSIDYGEFVGRGDMDDVLIVDAWVAIRGVYVRFQPASENAAHVQAAAYDRVEDWDDAEGVSEDREAVILAKCDSLPMGDDLLQWLRRVTRPVDMDERN